MSLGTLANDMLLFMGDLEHARYLLLPATGALIGCYDGRQDARQGKTPLLMDIAHSHRSAKCWAVVKRYKNPVLMGTGYGILMAALVREMHLVRHVLDAGITFATVTATYTVTRGPNCRLYRRKVNRA